MKAELAKEILSNFDEGCVFTDIAYSRGINGTGYHSFSTHEVDVRDGMPDIHTYRTFEPKDDHLEITVEVHKPEIPWNKNIKHGVFKKVVYIEYERITHISEKI